MTTCTTFTEGDYAALTLSVYRVLTTGKERLARWQQAPDPWADAPASLKPKPEERKGEQMTTKTFVLAGGDDLDEEDEEGLPALLRTPAQPARNMGDWIAENIASAREPFQPHFDDLLSRVKAREWRTQKACAETYHKPARWVTDLKKVALAQRVMTTGEWDQCFKDCKGNRAEKRQ